jgi:hypothetical protein
MDAQEFARAALEFIDEGNGLVASGEQRSAHHFLEEAFLAVEVEIDRALADAGAYGDVVELGGRETLGREFFQRGIDDGVAARFLLLLSLSRDGWGGNDLGPAVMW